jgi:arginyl-tRNA synthetase
VNIYAAFKGEVVRALEALIAEGKLPEGLDFTNVVAEPPRDASHGDIATNAAMVLAKPAQKSPRDIAALLVEKLEALDDVTSAEIAGPGFINLRLKDAVWQGIVAEVLASGAGYGNSDMGKGEKVNVEYVSANPTGPMHIGHARGAVVGDVLALLMVKAGYDVTKEYYINDAGAQVDVLARSAHLRYLEAMGEDITIPEGLYPGEYLIPVGEALKEAFGDKFKDQPEDVWLTEVRQFTIDAMMEMIKQDLGLLGIVHDVFSSERTLVDADKVQETLELLDQKGLIYEGVLEPPKGKKPDDWEEREQTLFKATEFGDDVDRPVKKSDGSWTYFASDVAYHYDKINRGFLQMINVLGADHGGYVKRIKASVLALSDKKAVLDVQLYQLVNFLEDGKPLKMSKRAGTFTTVRDVVEAVGKDVVRFLMLTRKSDMILDFDLQKATEQSKDNPVFYVQYAHARNWSVLRNAAEVVPEAVADDFTVSEESLRLLSAPEELDLVKAIAGWPRVVEAAAGNKEPHRIAFYLQDLAASFHQLWNRGKDDPSLRFIIEENEELTKARLALVRACSITIGTGLHVLGVEPVREM